MELPISTANMDTSMCLYKGKLKEALALFMGMTTEKKAEAVAYWNDLAEQLQNIAPKEGSLKTPVMSHVSHSRTSVDSMQQYTGQTDCTTMASVSELVQTSSDTMNINVLKSDSDCQFIQGNHLNKALLQSAYLDVPLLTIDQSKVHLSNSEADLGANVIVAADYRDPTKYQVATSSDQNCAILPQGTLGPSNCISSQQESPVQASDSYGPLKHSTVTTVSHHQADIENSRIKHQDSITTEVYCDSVNASHPQLISYITGDGTTGCTDLNRIHQSGINSGPGLSNVILSSSTCPKTTSDISAEIGNGQYDRGPKLFDDLDGFINLGTTPPTTIDIGSEIDHSPFLTNRAGIFTHSERPLQQIQLFNPISEDYLATQHYAMLDNRGKFQLDQIEDSDRQSKLHPNDRKPSSNFFMIESSDPTLSKDGDSGRSVGDKLSSHVSQHTCEICGKSGFSTKGNLKRHQRAHSGEKPFKCEYCESCFTEKKSLKIHVRRHTGEKPYKCEVCGKLFSQTGVLQSHMALHLNERKFDCQKCGKAFRQRSQLKLHLMRHDGVKRLGCSTCFAKFLTKGDLERHCRIHTGERPYACKICNKTFTRQQSLNEHMNRHTGRRPYDCKFCDKTFSEMSACYKHAKTHKRQDQVITIQKEPSCVQ